MRKPRSKQRSVSAPSSTCVVRWQLWPSRIDGSYRQQPDTGYRYFDDTDKAEVFVRELRAKHAEGGEQCLVHIEVLR